jgi:hypothetical protein
MVRMPRDDRLRSLERKRMETIFAPLDPDEPLPRELLHESRRLGFFAIPVDRTVGRRELAGALWLPALAAVLLVAGWGHVNGLLVAGVLVLLLLGFVVFARSGERQAR